MVCHNYRRVPALALAREMIARGELGERIFHFRAHYLQDWIVDPEFPLVWRLGAGDGSSGSLGDIGAHAIDLGRYLVGEFREVCATLETFIKRRPRLDDPKRTGRVTVDDAALDDRTFPEWRPGHNRGDAFRDRPAQWPNDRDQWQRRFAFFRPRGDESAKIL